MKIKQIHHVAHRCTDAKEKIKWYRTAPVAVMHQIALLRGPTFVKGLLRSIHWPVSGYKAITGRRGKICKRFAKNFVSLT